MKRVAIVMAGLLAVSGPAAAKKGDEHWTTTWTSDSDRTEFAYGLVEQADDGGSLTINGTESDRNTLVRLKEKTDGTFVWIRSGSRRWLIQDEKTIARAKEVLEPELEVSRHAGELGTLQSTLGDAQSKVGIAQSDIGVRQAEIGTRQARIATELVRPGLSKARERELNREMEALQDEMEELSRAQENLGAKQERMGKDQGRLGDEQGKGGEQDKAVYAEVRAGMKRLLDDAIASGAARRI